MTPTENKSFKGEFTNKKGDKITVKTPVVLFDQDGSKIVYAPTLELYGYGLDLKEAKNSLEVNLEEFINYTLNKGTFMSELKRLGWVFKKRKKTYIVPSFSKMLRKNEELIDILDNNDKASIQKHEVSLPMA